jgi:guanylate kinase
MAIIALVGKTASGKDTIARYITETYNIPQVVSFTTRPIRPSEQNGREHYFVSKERMAELVADNKNLFAYTKFPETGYEYCASLDEEQQKHDWVYIIDPPGIEYLKEKHPEMEVLAIYVKLPEEEIIKRATKRGDNAEAIQARLNSERDIMNGYVRSGQWDAVVNNFVSKESALHQVDGILQKHLGLEPANTIDDIDDIELGLLPGEAEDDIEME